MERLLAPHALVASTDRDTAPVVSALRSRGLATWSDRVDRVTFDTVSIAWADAVIVIGGAPAAGGPLARTLRHFPGTAILCTTAALTQHERLELLAGPFDAVLDWPAPPALIAAYTDRFLRRTMGVSGHTGPPVPAPPPSAGSDQPEPAGTNF